MKIFIDQYVKDVVDDMFCMSSTELLDAIDKIERYVPLYEGTKRGEILHRVIEKLRSIVPTADDNYRPYVVNLAHHDDRWSSKLNT